MLFEIKLKIWFKIYKKCLEKQILDQEEIGFFLQNHSSIGTVRILVWLLLSGFNRENSEYKLSSISRKLAQIALTKQIWNVKNLNGFFKKEELCKKKNLTIYIKNNLLFLHKMKCCIIYDSINYKLSED